MIPESKFLVCAVIALGLTGAVRSAGAAIAPGALLTNNAVLQRNRPDRVWGTADPGEPISVSIAGQTVKTVADAGGSWLATLKPMAAGGPYTLTIAGVPGDAVTLHNVLVGEVWVCGGQSNMEFPLKSASTSPVSPTSMVDPADPLLRFVKVSHAPAIEPRAMVAGAWQEATRDSLGGATAVGYFFARDLRRALKVPVGYIDDCWGGTPAQTWISKEGLASSPLLHKYVDWYQAQRDKYAADKAKYDADASAAAAAGKTAAVAAPDLAGRAYEFESNFTLPMHLYNGMIAPIVNYGIRGVIWSQGESNADSAWLYKPNGEWEYKTLFPALIGDWRAHWGEGDFPFLFVQLAPHYAIVDAPYKSDQSGWQELREAQRLTSLTCRNAYMAVITDLGDVKTIHPTRKEAVGDRLALLARSMVYEEKNIEAFGPVYSGYTVQGGAIRVSFTHSEGLRAIDVHDGSDDGPLVATRDKLVGFELAGKDGVYYAADARIDGDSVVVTSASVPEPLTVRYGWANYPIANLANASGLPASPFKADNQPWASEPKS